MTPLTNDIQELRAWAQRSITLENGVMTIDASRVLEVLDLLATAEEEALDSDRETTRLQDEVTSLTAELNILTESSSD